MSISLKTRKMLWGRSANRCVFPDCRRQLVEDETETDDASIVGDEAHIVAREGDGPRGKSELSVEQRDKYDNLILLCKIHHKVVDDQPETYTVDVLRDMKVTHVDWVDRTLDLDSARQKDDEVYGTYIDRWMELADVDEWEGWSSFVLGSGQPHMRVSRMEQLDELNRYLLSRVWPRRYSEIENAFHNFARILNDFRSVFMKHAKPEDTSDDPFYWTEKFYKIGYYDTTVYHELSRRFDYHVDLVEDLMLELTRAANQICDEVRRHLSASFRIEEGVVLVMSGPHMDFSFKTSRTEYHGERDEDRSYPGLRRFMEIRTQRDRHFGEGVDESYFHLPEME